jgi:glycine amidinotransferase/scyllo-inosamine-4-phosphate amidinotransferase 1
MLMINSYNEWDPLEEIVVGSATWANWPTNDPMFARESTKTTWTESPVPSGPVPQWIIDEANEDLDTLADTLTKLGVVVHRPREMNFQELGGMYNYCPRDRLLIAGSTVIDAAMMYPCRNQEIQALDFVIDAAEQVITMPKNSGYVLDAANILRLGKDRYLFLESASGNRLSWYWLLSTLPPTTSMEICNFYSGVHIDSTIVPLREGLVLLNGSRVNKSTCPQAFRDWECIYVDDVVAQDFYQYPYASKWIGLNMLVVDPNTVIVDAAQHDLIELLARKNFTVIPRTLRHSRTLGGGFHCVTLDLRRRHA